MCGIFTAFRCGESGFTETELARAIQEVAHRGPDASGQFYDGVAFLGHTRLAIVGLEAASNQPFHYEDYSIVFNGEIFNYLELRDELATLGYKFDTNSDTEVVVKAFDCWGQECFSRFNGMWAIVIYDRKRRALTACRDRFGQKPLFVMVERGAIFFASEVQQLVPFSTREIDFKTIQAFLREGGYDSQGRTFFVGIEEFPKAHLLTVDSNGTLAARRYWDYPSGPVQKTDESTFQEFAALLEDSVRLRLRADVPLGVLVSGGLDSTIVAALARKGAGPDASIPAFTYSSKDAYDESKYARQVAEILSFPITFREQAESSEEYRRRLRALVKQMGRGHSSPAVVSVDSLYEAVAASGIRIALDGQGADELLAGYKNYYAEMVPWYVAHGRFREAYLMVRDQYRSGIANSMMIWLRNVLPPQLRYIGRLLYGYERFFRAAPDRNHPPSVVPEPSSSRNGNKLNRYLIPQHRLGLENLLYYGDIAAMRNSVENRSPFMDHRLIEFVFRHDEKLKVWNGINKYAIRTLPVYPTFREIVEREKIGFSSDIKPQTKAMMVEELKTSPILDWPIFKPGTKAFVEKGGLLRPKYERFLFRLYQVHLWHEAFYRERAG